MKKIFLSIATLIFAQCMVYSSTATVYKYRIYCITESQNVYEWAETPPTTCPHNTAHTINLNSISIVDQQGPDILSIKEESTPTGGHYRAQTETLVANAGPDVSTSMQFSWPFDISVLAIYIMADATTAGDIINVTIGKDTVYGTLSDNVNTASTIIPVSSSVITNIAKGYYVTLDDSINTDNVGRVTAVNAIDNTINVETATTHAFAATTPTLVKVNIKPIDNFQLVAGLPFTLGIKKIGGTFLPANTIVTIDYLNKGNAQKTLVFGYEYLY